MTFRISAWHRGPGSASVMVRTLLPQLSWSNAKDLSTLRSREPDPARMLEAGMGALTEGALGPPLRPLDNNDGDSPLSPCPPRIPVRSSSKS